MEKLSYFLYNFQASGSRIMDTSDLNFVTWYSDKHGFMYAFIFLLAISFIAAAIFYFGVSKTVVNANKKNYWTIFGLGLFVLIIVTIVGLKLIFGNGPGYFCMNLFKLNLLNAVYYVILYEVWSLVLLPMSKAAVHMFSK